MYLGLIFLRIPGSTSTPGENAAEWDEWDIDFIDAISLIVFGSLFCLVVLLPVLTCSCLVVLAIALLLRKAGQSAAAIFVVGVGFMLMSAGYVRARIGDPPFSAGTTVELVRAKDEPEHTVRSQFNFVPARSNGEFPSWESRPTETAPLVSVYYVPARHTVPLATAYPPRADTDLGEMTTLFHHGEITEAAMRTWQGKIEKQTAEEQRLKKLKGPNGIVFTKESPTEQAYVEGEVFEHSRAVVVADDQGGGPERGVLVRLTRDPSLAQEMGPDPGVLVVIRASNLQCETQDNTIRP
jgi:hypothetical protein